LGNQIKKLMDFYTSEESQEFRIKQNERRAKAATDAEFIQHLKCGSGIGWVNYASSTSN
jgi:hypothetical protein